MKISKRKLAGFLGYTVWTGLNIIMLAICFYLSMSGFDLLSIDAAKNSKLSKQIFLICFAINLVVAFLVAWISQSYNDCGEKGQKMASSIGILTLRIFGKVIALTILPILSLIHI